jgi:hypothetical protein
MAGWSLASVENVIPYLEAEAQAARDLVERPPAGMTGAEWSAAADRRDRIEGRLSAARWHLKARSNR